MRTVYLDHNATTPVDPAVRDAMLPYLEEGFGNPSSLHSFGRTARVALDEARDSVAALVGGDPLSVIFVSSGTEANNLAIRGTAAAHRDRARHLVVSAVEHNSVMETCRAMEADGFRTTIVPVDETGRVEPEAVAEAISDETLLVALMHANNEMGTIQPVEKVAELARERGVPVLVDAVQTVGKIPLDVLAMGCDMVSLSSHKLYGPKGAGALYVRKGLELKALITGGAHELSRRAGTENVPCIVGFGAACRLATERREADEKRTLRLRDRLWKGVAERIPGVFLNGDPVSRLPNTLNVSFEAVEGESVVINLDLKGIAVSTGSACSSGKVTLSPVLLAMGLDEARTRGSVRFSLGRGTTEDDIDHVLDVLPPVIERLRNLG
ncbi:MAG: cysteine desulfurase [Nitrospinae bacterium]|nr:cysteine desulfurase [Nitrospinota bacterium]